MLSHHISLQSQGLELLINYYHAPCVKIRNQLVRLNAGLVRKIAHHLSHQCAEPYEDLEQIGYLGLIQAIERFNPSHGYAFSSFAVPYIRGEILHFLRDRAATVKIPRRWQEIQRTAQKVQESLCKNLNRPPTEQEIAEQLAISLEEWQEIKLAQQNRAPLSLDATICQQKDTSLTLGETLLDEHSQRQRHYEEECQQLHHALAQLEEKTRVALESVFIQGMSRKAVAEKIGVSPMTVSRWIQRGQHQLLKTLELQSA
jgi:RNA polymerase sigma-B factor